jgi:hypothetical protein
MGLATTLHERDFAAGIPFAYTAVRGSAAIPVLVVMAWRRNNSSRATRLHYSTVALAAVLRVPYLTHWGLLGFGP